MSKWKVGDRVAFDKMFNEFTYGKVVSVTERVLYEIKWDDGFDDKEGNMIAEWELFDPTEVEDLYA